jgi:hypothetical protein
MSNNKSSVFCDLLFKMSRRHGWGNPITIKGLTDLALKDSQQGSGQQLAEDLVEKPYIKEVQQGQYAVPNNPDSQAQIAFVLREKCGYTELQLEATLSRFEQAGGFDAYERDKVLDGLSWP